MDKISELMNRLSELSPEELSELKTSIVSEFEALDSQETPTRESVEAMSSLADAHDQVTLEESNREEEAKELSQLAADAANRIKGSDEETEEDKGEESEEVDEAEGVEALSTETEAVSELSTDSEDSATDEDQDEDDDEKKEFSVESETEAEAPAEEEVTSELSEETPEEAQLSEEVAEEATLSNDSVVESEDDNNVNTLSSIEEPTQESEDTAVTSSIDPNFEAPAENAPVVAEEVAYKATITAAADIKGFASGAPMPNLKSVAQAFLDRRKAMGRTSGGDGEQALVASISHQDAYDESRRLDSGDVEGIREKVDAVVASVKLPGAVVAAGGLYGPVETSYDIYELGETLGRPVRDSLPSFNADRGGLRFMTPPVLADLEGAVSVWTLQDDIAAANNSRFNTEEGDLVKPAIRVKAGEEVTVYLEAMPLILTFGNLGARAYPELVERHIELAMIWQARFAESRLLSRIGYLSTKVTAEAELGAARDILVQADTAASAMRNRHRLDENAPLRAIFPLWFKNALRSDLVKQIPGDGQDAALSLADATISRWFTERNINVTWSLDGEGDSSTTATPVGDGQILGAQADGPLKGFPTHVIWYLFPEGTFLFLEDATIDLGLVRDSTLNASNDYQMFIETFENVAKVGVESLRIKSELKIVGSSSGTTDLTA